MQFRSAKSFSRIFSSAFVLLALAIVPATAGATIEITSRQSTGKNDRFWFAGKRMSSATDTAVLEVSGATNPAFADAADPDYDFRVLNFAATAGSDPSGSTNGITFVLRSDKADFQTPAGSSQLVAVVRVFTSNGQTTGSMFAPIIAASPTGGEPTTCDGTFCATLGTSQGFFYGAAFTKGQDLAITILPREICVNNSRLTPGSFSGCDASAVDDASTFQMFVKFSIIAVPGLNSAPAGVSEITDATSLDDGPTQTILNFQTGSPTFPASACPDLSNIYEPGDGEILVDTNPFAISIPSGGAPGTSLIAIANATDGDVTEGTNLPAAYHAHFVSQAAVTAALTSGGDNEVVSRVEFQTGQRGMKGFTNTNAAPPTGSPAYQIVFAVRDAAGMVAASLDTAPACSLANVRTADIQGFLDTGKCFIATAAFRDAEGPPLEMLRAFRDEVLLRFGWGQDFVRWYYAWSPGAAEWLMRNPEFRHPVLLALLPVQALAWLTMRPAIFAALALIGMLLIGSAVARRVAR